MIGTNMSPQNPEPLWRDKDRAVRQRDRLTRIDRVIKRGGLRIGEQGVEERIRHARSMVGLGQHGTPGVPRQRAASAWVSST